MSTTPVEPVTAPADSPPTSARRRIPFSAATTRLLRRLHFYAGLLVAPFLIVAAVSGGLYALAPAAEKVIYRAQLHTDSTGPAQSLSDQIAAAQASRPDLTPVGVRPAPGTGDTTQVLFADPSLGESEKLAVFVDPVTLNVQGELPTYGSGGALPVRAWISGLHRNLNLGEPGRFYSELAASWLWIIALAGLVMWVLAYRKRRRATGSARLLTVDRKATGRPRTMNRHAVLGVWILLPLLFLSATGLTWSKLAGENIAELRQSLNWLAPGMSTSLSGQESAGHGGHEGHGGGAPAADAPAEIGTRADAALALARSVGVGVDDAVEITLPADAQTAYTVTEIRAAGQFSPDSAAVDPATDTVVAVNRFADWPLMAQAANLGIALHMGLLFGLVNQLVLFAVAVILVLIIVWGYRMWWQRRPRGATRPGRAPTRGGCASCRGRRSA